MTTPFRSTTLYTEARTNDHVRLVSFVASDGNAAGVPPGETSIELSVHESAHSDGDEFASACVVASPDDMRRIAHRILGFVGTEVDDVTFPPQEKLSVIGSLSFGPLGPSLLVRPVLIPSGDVLTEFRIHLSSGADGTETYATPMLSRDQTRALRDHLTAMLDAEDDR